MQTCTKVPNMQEYAIGTRSITGVCRNGF